jgi:menaquinone-dependent protoporphyrinogen oxidase
MDDSAERQEIPPTKSLRKRIERVGARGHVTFGGRLAPDARGFPASSMARKHSSDWLNREHIRAWAFEVARALGARFVAPGPGRRARSPDGLIGSNRPRGPS